jgi:hypothetical protein
VKSFLYPINREAESLSILLSTKSAEVYKSSTHIVAQQPSICSEFDNLQLYKL